MIDDKSPSRTFDARISNMNRFVASVVAFGLFTACAYTQTAPQEAARVSVCDLANEPSQYAAKLVRVRAQVWSDCHTVWMNESAVDSMQIGMGCRWLRVEFKRGTNLWCSTGFATFTGQIVQGPQFSNSISALRRGHVPFIFLVEDESDIYDQKIQNGVIRRPQVYDQTNGTLERPD